MYDYINYKPQGHLTIYRIQHNMDSKIEIRDHGICNHIKRDITLSLVGIDLFFVVVEGSANRFGTMQGHLVLPIFFTFFL